MSGDEVIDLDGGSRQEVSEWLDILIEILQLLVDHCSKDSLDLTLLEMCRGRR